MVEALAALAESICQGVQWVVSESPRSLCTPGARAGTGKLSCARSEVWYAGGVFPASPRVDPRGWFHEPGHLLKSLPTTLVRPE